MILLTGLYVDPDPSRRAEFTECLRRNAANEHIRAVHLFIEEPLGTAEVVAVYSTAASPKVTVHTGGGRATFQQLFAFAAEHCAGERVIIANSDLYFDDTLRRLADVDLSRRMLCLSRWDVQSDGTARLFDFQWSQDAWIFDSPLPAFSCEFCLGIPGCDNRVAWEAHQAGVELSNPSRSIRAFHLHTSMIRRYTERQRLAGHGQAVPPTWLGTPWVWFVVTCHGRLADVQRTSASVIEQPRSTYVLVDYGCPDRSGDWMRAASPRATVITAPDRRRFDGAHARNLGAAAADDDGIVCFLDADVGVTGALTDAILAKQRPNRFLVPDRREDAGNFVACTRRDFDRQHGFDEVFKGSGDEVVEFTGRLRAAGLQAGRLPATLFSHTPGDRAAVMDDGVERRRRTTRATHAAYRRLKAAIHCETAGAALSPGTLREIYDAVDRRHRRDALADLPCAAIAFSETMGYTIQRLEPGVSSHNNDARPFVDVPDTLAGRLFTQVVSGSAAPVEVEFLSPGRAFVLVGTDWHGYDPATAWLRANGHEEAIPRLDTCRGTGFEVWSIVGERGDRYGLPTQVMLVADHLEKR